MAVRDGQGEEDEKSSGETAMLRSMLIASALAAAPVAPALADHSRPSITFELGIGVPDHRRYERGPNVSRRDAIQIAYDYGMTDVRDVDLDDGVWELEGRTWEGDRMEIEISAWDGQVLDLDYRGGRGRARGHDDDHWNRGW